MRAVLAELPSVCGTVIWSALWRELIISEALQEEDPV